MGIGFRVWVWGGVNCFFVQGGKRNIMKLGCVVFQVWRVFDLAGN